MTDSLDTVEVQENELDIEKVTEYRSKLPLLGAILLVSVGVGVVYFFGKITPNINDKEVQTSIDDIGYFENIEEEQVYENPIRERVTPVKDVKPAAKEDKKSKKSKKRSRLLFSQQASSVNSSGSVNVNSNQQASITANTALVETSLDSEVKKITTSEVYERANRGTLINAGTYISACLVNAVNNQLGGDLVAYVSNNVYSSDGKRLLIPRYSQLLGHYRSGQSHAETRIFAIWDRLRIENDKYITLGSQAYDNLGRAGLNGTINSRFAKRFGASILLSILPVLVDHSLDDNDAASTRDIVDAAGSDLESVAQIALQNSINIPAIIYIPQARCFNVLVNKDLDFSSIL